MKFSTTITIAVAALAVALVDGSKSEMSITTELDVPTQMYLFAWPLVMTSLTRKSMFYLPDNLMLPLPVFPNPNLTAIVKPNVDTLYDACWINHEKVDQLVLNIPDTSDGVYYLFPLMDAWTNVIESPGWRTTGKNSISGFVKSSTRFFTIHSLNGSSHSGPLFQRKC